MAFIRKLKPGRYRAEVKYNGKFFQNKVFPTQKEAERWGKKIATNIDAILELSPDELNTISLEQVEELGGIELFKKLGVDLDIVTLRQLANEYMSQWTGKDTSLIYRVKYWVDVFDDTPIKAITSRMIHKQLKSYCQDYSNNSALRLKACISSLFKYAVNEYYIEHNPAAGVKIKAVKNTRDRRLQGDERERLLKACRNSKGERLHLLVIMAMGTGMRLSELLGLTWSDINVEKRLATLNDTKNGDSRICPVPEPVIDELNKFRGIGQALVFPSAIDPYKPYYHRNHWDAALKEAGISDGFVFHSLRHSFCSDLADAGASAFDIKELAGHKSIQTTQRYTHLDVKRKQSVSDSIMGKLIKV